MTARRWLAAFRADMQWWGRQGNWCPVVDAALERVGRGIRRLIAATWCRWFDHRWDITQCTTSECNRQHGRCRWCGDEWTIIC